MKRWRRDAFTKLSDAGSTTLTSRDALGLGVVLIVAAALRVAFIDQSLWFDEYASVFFASQPLSRLWSTWMVRETNPPLFYSVLHIWIDSARRIDAVWLRVIPIAANLATVTVVFNEVRRLYGTRTGLIAASLLAVSAQHIAYALQVRAYSMMGLALAVSFFGLMRVVAARDREGRPSGAWAMYVAGALAAIYLHTTAVLWPLIASLSLIVVDRRFVPLRGAAWRTLAAADLLILLGASWWLYVTYLQIASPNGNLAWMMAADLRTSISVFARSIFLVREIYGVQLAMPVMLLGLAVLGIVRTWTSPATRLTMVCLALSAIVYLVANLKQPIVVERAIVWMSVFPVVLVAAGIGSLRWRTAVVALTGLALMLPIVNLMKNRSFEHENWGAGNGGVIERPSRCRRSRTARGWDWRPKRRVGSKRQAGIARSRS